jgi:putative protease
VEETRPGEYFPLEEDQRGSYVFNSRDLCLLEQLPALKTAGVSSVKIEGRMKSSYYVAVATRVYRRALDLLEGEDGETAPEIMASLKNELTRVSHRGYTSGFAAGKMAADAQNPGDSSYIRNYRYEALVLGVEEPGKKGGCVRLHLAVKSPLRRGRQVEVVDPDFRDFTACLLELENLEGKSLAVVHPGQEVRAVCTAGAFRPGQLLRSPAGAKE